MGKIILGTVQFGQNYGINNKSGQIPEGEVFEILNFAFKNGINTLDTAYNYGDSEKVIGKFLKSTKKQLRIISKLPSTETDQINKIFKRSIKNLNIEKMYGYLFHNFQSFLDHPENLEAVKKLKKQKLIRKIGFSLYYPHEAQHLLDNNIEFDIVQVPYNIFDQRFESIIQVLKQKGKEIHSRSVFLQGLMFKKPKQLTGSFKKIKNHIQKINYLAKDLNSSVSAICLNFALSNQNIDKVVIGVDNLDNLKENINGLKSINEINNHYQTLLKLKVTDEDIILPTNWKK